MNIIFLAMLYGQYQDKAPRHGTHTFSDFANNWCTYVLGADIEFDIYLFIYLFDIQRHPHCTGGYSRRGEQSYKTHIKHKTITNTHIPLSPYLIHRAHNKKSLAARFAESRLGPFL